MTMVVLSRLFRYNQVCSHLDPWVWLSEVLHWYTVLYIGKEKNMRNEFKGYNLLNDINIPVEAGGS